MAAATVFLLAVIHGACTSHVAIDRIVDGTHVAATFPGLRPGDEFPVYRFSGEWKSAIGQVVVESVEGERVLFRFDPTTFRWPMGRHGTITAVDGGSVTVNMGSNLGLVLSDTLIVFDGREQVGRVTLAQVGKESSSGVPIGGGPLRPGLGVSEFLVPTQIVVFANPFVAALEIFLPSLLLLGYLAGWLRLGRSPFSLAGGKAREIIGRLDSPAMRTVMSLLVAAPFVWLFVRFLVLAVPYLLRAALATAVGWLHFDPGDSFDPINSLGDLLGRNTFPLAILGLASYCFVLFGRKASPIGLLWNAISFRGGLVKGVKPGAARDIAIWLLHLVIAYFFAYSLFSFLKGNLNAALELAWPGSGVHVSGAFNPAELWELIRSLGGAALHMLTHAPQFVNTESAWITARYILWSLTILGCLVGYGHSILGYLWGKRIRNLDFTIPGWISNAVCYGPLLGMVAWQMVPPLQGQDPIFASGPLFHLDLATEFFLDLVYMLTIWNLGTMFGVMTDKGVRRTGFYSVVRHPSYTIEALMFVALELKGLTTGHQWLAAGMFLVWYWIRSEREDVFMSRSNPEYEEYKALTKFKFIPGLY